MAVKHACSVRDQISWRLVFERFTFSFFHTSKRNRSSTLENVWHKVAFWWSFCARKTNTPKKKKCVSKHTDTYAWGLISTVFYLLYKKKFHYSCLNSKSLLSSIFYPAFSFFVPEFPAYGKLSTVSTITYFHALFFLRWLDTVFQGQYLPSLGINYVAINKDLEKWPTQLY